MKRLAAVGCQLSALLVAAVVHAQTANPGVDAERFVPALGPTALVGVEGAAVTAPGAVSWAASLDLLQDPIKLTERYTGDLVTRPVHDALVGDVALEFGIWKRIAVAVGVPVALYQNGDRLRGTGVDEAPLAATVAGDIRMRLKAQLVGDATAPGVHAAILLQVTAPGGGRTQFEATDGATVEPRVLVDARLGRLMLAASLGARFAPERTLFLTTIGDELTWSAGAALAVIERRRVGLSAIVEGAGGVGASDGTRPAELRGALRLGLRGVSLDAGAGGGVDGDLGAPAWRVFVVARGGLPLTP